MSGFESPNFTQAPNDLWDMLPTMHETELKVTLAAIRHTFGYHRKRVKLSITAMEKLTGLSRQGVLNGAEAAEERGTLTRTSDGGTTVWVVNVVDPPPDMVVNSVDHPPESVNPVDQRSQPGRPAGVNAVDHLPLSKKRIKEKGKKDSALAPRPRDPLFDAIVEVCQVDLTLKGAGTKVGKVRAVLAGASPPYTPEEVYAFRDRWWAWEERESPPTVWKLQDSISSVRSKNGRSGKLSEPKSYAALRRLAAKKGLNNGE